MTKKCPYVNDYKCDECKYCKIPPHQKNGLNNWNMLEGNIIIHPMFTQDGTCPYCGVILNVYWHYGLDGNPWCWCQNCKQLVKINMSDINVK